jgi:nucleoside-diphosphate-sugar epimerase
MQTILGSVGVISRELAESLREYTTDIRLVARNPKAFHESNELVSADLTNAEDTLRAVEGSEVAYFVAGFPYSYKSWSAMWPVAMKNVIEACKTHGTKLVFFDNIYMYDPEYLGNMTEDTPHNPSSKKGGVRKQIIEMMMKEVDNGSLTALVARCADYYGPGIERNAVLNETVFKNLAKGKKANWMGPLDYKHSFTYTPDAGKATAMLGNTPDAFNQTWHLPTASNPPTGQEWLDTIAKKLGAKPKAMILTPFLAGLMGIFVPVMKELKEMMYQYDRDYVFNSDKFEKRFNFTPTSYEEGVDQTIANDYPKS